jgi:para-aminobenzoate synthetase component 1
VNPAPFAAFLNLPEVQVLSASPERFLHFDPTSRRVQTRPIKGTRPRGRTPERDRALSRELLSSEKDLAENVMIVDVERNDLGRVAEIGSVRVPHLAALERFATVFHLTSTVEARLRDGCDVVDLLLATFPSGSITGAPKIRAMEIIDELEPTARSVYTGAIGYIGFDGVVDLNIAIRTILVKGETAYFQAGGGIVADSDPELEYQETLDKASALARAVLNEG